MEALLQARTQETIHDAKKRSQKKQRSHPTASLLFFPLALVSLNTHAEEPDRTPVQQQPTATNKQQSQQTERKTHKTLTLFAINRPFGRSNSSRSHWMRQTSLAEVGRWLHKGALVTAGDAVVGGGGVAVSAGGRCHILRLGLVGGVCCRECVV